MKQTICTAILLALLTLQDSRAAEDPRFTSGNLGVENAYWKEFAATVLKAFDRSGWSLSGLEGVRKVGGTYVISGFVSLDEIKEPITEKDFERINSYFEPFIQSQIELYKNNGFEITSTQNDWPLPSHAKGYTKDKLPRMTYVISGTKEDLFLMDVRFSERKDDHLVVGFTIVAVP
jgi:hypothetical protein